MRALSPVVRASVAVLATAAAVRAGATEPGSTGSPPGGAASAAAGAPAASSSAAAAPSSPAAPAGAPGAPPEPARARGEDAPRPREAAGRSDPAADEDPPRRRRRHPRGEDGEGESRAERGEARVHVAVDRPGAWLEARSWVDDSEWRRACATPCSRVLFVDGQQFRVQAPGMTPSNPFRVEPGSGTARIRVTGGDAAAREWGTIALAAGIPLSLAGMAGFAYGRLRGREGLETAGAAVLGLGAAAVVISFPLVSAGGTVVRNSRGRTIARAPSARDPR